MDAGLAWCGSGLRPGGFCNPTCRPCLLGGLVCGRKISWHRLHERHQHHEGFSAQRFPFGLLSRPGDLYNGAGSILKASSNSFQYCSVSKIMICSFPWQSERCAPVSAVPGRLQSTPAPSPAPQPCSFQSHFPSSLPVHIPTPRWGITSRAHL